MTISQAPQPQKKMTKNTRIYYRPVCSVYYTQNNSNTHYTDYISFTGFSPDVLAVLSINFYALYLTTKSTSSCEYFSSASPETFKHLLTFSICDGLNALLSFLTHHFWKASSKLKRLISGPSILITRRLFTFSVWRAFWSAILTILYREKPLSTLSESQGFTSLFCFWGPRDPWFSNMRVQCPNMGVPINFRSFYSLSLTHKLV